MPKLFFIFFLSFNSLSWGINQLIEDTFSFEYEPDSSYLFRIENEAYDCAYVNVSGDTIVPFGKYMACFDDTLKYFAAVYSKEQGMIAINAFDEKLFSIFPYDNGPDYLSEGMLRIIEKDKIGYANKYGNVVIKPMYPCAYPFENGKAQVTINCTKTKNGDYTFWESTEWIYIDKKGNVISE
jgi:hypothetical protein